MSRPGTHSRVEYDIHGRLGLHLTAPPPSVRRVVSRQMDPLRPTSLSAEPDVKLTPVDGVPSAGQEYQLGDAGDSQLSTFGDEQFWLFRGAPAFSIPFGSIGEDKTAEIRYVRGINFRRLLVEYVRPILHLALTAKGAAAVHSAAVSYKGKGILFAGWSESGKTEAMLGFLKHGAAFVSDKWSMVSENGEVVENFPTPITVRGWMLTYMPELGASLSRVDWWRARMATAVSAISEAAADRVDLAKRLGGMVNPVVNLGTRVSVTPSQLFEGREGVSMELSAPLSTVFLLMTRQGDISVRPAAVDEVVSRLTNCAAYERRSLRNLYLRFRYAYPSSRSAAMEEAREAEAAVLGKALKGKDVFIVEAPFPFDPEAIYQAVSPYCR